MRKSLAIKINTSKDPRKVLESVYCGNFGFHFLLAMILQFIFLPGSRKFNFFMRKSHPNGLMGVSFLTD